MLKVDQLSRADAASTLTMKDTTVTNTGVRAQIPDEAGQRGRGYRAGRTVESDLNLIVSRLPR